MTETKAKIETCDLCHEPLTPPPEAPELRCDCMDKWGAYLVHAHRDYTARRDTIPLTIYTSTAVELLVVEGVELPEKGPWITLHGVSMEGEEGVRHDSVEIRLSDIAFIGFNLP